ncbi:AAA family ATPase [Candidatus Babela massiliensis]|uniref:ATPase of the AAA+ class n=1 Tax=Candidatus Babela massiliensis TaxID=673862 RepID=V6DEX1_9BACT|nr:ATP-binding protein [Candidatus Babela massiliensis]CDK30125.1 ATPase of the AAA+ class [Candidatus Babela massiliensis]
MKIGVKNKIVFLTVLSSIVIGNIYTSKINSSNTNTQEENNSDIIQYQVDIKENPEIIALSGYNALKNGLIIVDALREKTDPTFDINNQKISQDLFGNTDSPWKKFIIDLRKSKSQNNILEGSNEEKDISDSGNNLIGSEIEKLSKFNSYKKLDVPVIAINDIKKDIVSILNSIDSIITDKNVILVMKLDDRWITCVTDKSESDKIKFFMVDLLNLDLKQNDNLLNFIKLVKVAIKEITEEKNNPNELNFFKDNKNKVSFSNRPSNEEKNDYRSPYFDIETDQLPPLEQFFEGRIPNRVVNLIDSLKETTNKNFRTDTKKGLILYGPPGTGKSTIAEHIARASGREVLFIDGGSFKTEYQGSGAKIVTELFQAAKAKGKPVVIVIDEIDGATSKLRKNFGTSEDNQTIKKIISELNKHLLAKDSSIYLICTTNYLENIEGAILNRFSAIEVNAPSYQARINILLNYLRVNNINLEKDNPNNYEVSNNFIHSLATATRDWTGRDLQALVNSAVSEYRNPKLSPENDSLWRFMMYNQYDFKDRKIKSLLNLPILGLNSLTTYAKGYSKLEKYLYSSYLIELHKMKKIKEADQEGPLSDSFSKQVKNVAIGAVVGYVIQSSFKNIEKYLKGGIIHVLFGDMKDIKTPNP